jgi:hypothetical protein
MPRGAPASGESPATSRYTGSSEVPPAHSGLDSFTLLALSSSARPALPRAPHRAASAPPGKPSHARRSRSAGSLARARAIVHRFSRRQPRKAGSLTPTAPHRETHGRTIHGTHAHLSILAVRPTTSKPGGRITGHRDVSRVACARDRGKCCVDALNITYVARTHALTVSAAQQLGDFRGHHRRGFGFRRRRPERSE